MTAQQIREIRERWDWAHERLESVSWALGHLTDVKKSLEAECARLAGLIAEHDDTEIVITDESGVQHGD